MPPKKTIAEPNVVVPEGVAAAGREVFEQHCAACHALEGDDKSGSAPTLGTVIGRQAGTTAFTGYSKSMKTAGFLWSDKHLFVFLKNPSKYITGTRMAFAGLENEQERANLIAYLRG